MGNKVRPRKKEFLDILAWSYNSKLDDCKYLKKVSSKTQEKIIKDPIRFLKNQDLAVDLRSSFAVFRYWLRSDSKY